MENKFKNIKKTLYICINMCYNVITVKQNSNLNILKEVGIMKTTYKLTTNNPDEKGKTFNTLADAQDYIINRAEYVEKITEKHYKGDFFDYKIRKENNKYGI